MVGSQRSWHHQFAWPSGPTGTGLAILEEDSTSIQYDRHSYDIEDKFCSIPISAGVYTWNWAPYAWLGDNCKGCDCRGIISKSYTIVRRFLELLPGCGSLITISEMQRQWWAHRACGYSLSCSKHNAFLRVLLLRMAVSTVEKALPCKYINLVDDTLYAGRHKAAKKNRRVAWISSSWFPKPDALLRVEEKTIRAISGLAGESHQRTSLFRLFSLTMARTTRLKRASKPSTPRNHTRFKNDPRKHLTTPEDWDRSV